MESEAIAHEGSKASRAIFLKHGLVFTTGYVIFMWGMAISIFDTRKLDKLDTDPAKKYRRVPKDDMEASKQYARKQNGYYVNLVGNVICRVTSKTLWAVNVLRVLVKTVNVLKIRC